MRASFKRPRVDSSSSSAPPPPHPPTSGDPAADAYVDSTTVAVIPPPSISDDLSIRRMLETVMTVQAAHGQILVDMLTELQALQADLASFR